MPYFLRSLKSTLSQYFPEEQIGAFLSRGLDLEALAAIRHNHPIPQLRNRDPEYNGDLSSEEQTLSLSSKLTCAADVPSKASSLPGEEKGPTNIWGNNDGEKVATDGSRQDVLKRPRPDSTPTEPKGRRKKRRKAKQVPSTSNSASLQPPPISSQLFSLANSESDLTDVDQVLDEETKQRQQKKAVKKARRRKNLEIAKKAKRDADSAAKSGHPLPNTQPTDSSADPLFVASVSGSHPTASSSQHAAESSTARRPTLVPAEYSVFNLNMPELRPFTDMTRRQRRKHERSRYKLGIEVEVFVAEKGFKDLTKDARWSEKQWMGQNAPIDHRLALQADLDSGVPLEGFIRLDYLYKATKIADAKRRVVIFRSYVTKRMQDHILSKVIPEVERFIKDTSDPSLSDRRKNLRGLHWFCIAGGDRNLKRKPALTPWHRKHAEVIRQYFQKDRVFYKLTEYGCALVREVFPNVYRRFSECAEKMEKDYGLEALFGGIFFNFCINGTKFTVQERVMCSPHVDFKNVAFGVCMVFVYGHFNHREKCWLVVWEAGVVLELPPGVFLIYPSSLFLHFNVDISQVKFVVTEDGQRPTPSNSTPLNNNATSSASSEGEDSELEGLDPPRCSCGNSEDHGDKWEKAQGRGSIVWFNQASLFQTSELGYDTIEEAEAHGKDTHCNKSPDDMFETPW